MNDESSASSSRTNTDWKLCVICQNDDDDKEIPSSDEGCLSLANNLIEFWKIGQLGIDLKCLASDFKNGQPLLYNVFNEKEVQYHKDCHRKYNKQKLQRQKAKICKLEQCDTVARHSSIKRNANVFFCIICCNEESPDNMNAAGTFHANKDKINTKHNIELTEKLKKNGT